MYKLNALKLETEQAIIGFWVTVFLPIIIWCALPLRAMSDEAFLEGVSKGIELVVLNISGKGTFDPKRGNVVEWFRKALMGVRMEARKAAQVGTKSLEAIQEVNEDFDVVDDQDPTHELDDFELEMSNWMRLHTEEVEQEPANPDEDAIKHGDPQNDRIMFHLPDENFCPVYFTHESRFGKDENGKMVESYRVLKCVSAMPKKGAASYQDEDADDSNTANWLTRLDAEGELETDYEADERRDPDEENAFGSFMESYEGIFSHKTLLKDGIEQWVPDGKPYKVDGAKRTAPKKDTLYVSAYQPAKRKKNEPVDGIAPEVELCTPDDDQAEALMNPYQAPTAAQMAKALELFEIHATALKHLAYLQYKGQTEITVKSLDVQRGGFIRADGKFMSLAVAQGIAAAIKPVNGDTLKMAALVRQQFPLNADAIKFADRVEAVAALPLQ